MDLPECDTLRHMKEIKRVSLRDLHEKTGTVIREAAVAGYAVVVTDRGKPLVTITPYDEGVERRRFSERALSPAFVRMQEKQIAGDSTNDVSEDRGVAK
jgi:prevent-host-death family protein